MIFKHWRQLQSGVLLPKYMGISELFIVFVFS